MVESGGYERSSSSAPAPLDTRPACMPLVRAEPHVRRVHVRRSSDTLDIEISGYPKGIGGPEMMMELRASQLFVSKCTTRTSIR